MTKSSTVTVQNVKPVTVSPSRAWRIVLGRLVVRYVESFAGAVVGVTLFMPSNSADWQKLGAVLIGPALTSLYQALRSVWPAISAWLSSGGAEEPKP